MSTFVKAQAASVIATIADFVMTIVLVKLLALQNDAAVTAASATGTITGGVVNFMLGREWVFLARHNARSIQAGRYFLVWVGNLALNAGGVYMIIHYSTINYVAAKVLTAVLVAFSYNYFLQKKYVFR